ncbi:hypothetical protein MMC22_002522 [Lobaria immixta]|nr:hypothetical protein [Lobaria immixta]
MALTGQQSPSSSRLPGGGGRATYYSHRLATLRSTLAPLVSVTDHTAHPDFPATLLHYHLLTSPQLDALARHYHQSSPRVESWGYPVSVVGRWAVPSSPPPSSSSSFFPATTTTNSSSTLSINTAIMGLEPTTTTTTTTGSEQERRRRKKASLKARRRRFGRFIGLSGCESPTLAPEEAMREEERYVNRWVEREVMRRLGRGEKGGSKGLMF